MKAKVACPVGINTPQIQILAGFFGLTANAANTPGGTNYAIGGAFDNGGPGGLGARTNMELLSLGLPMMRGGRPAARWACRPSLNVVNNAGDA